MCGRLQRGISAAAALGLPSLSQSFLFSKNRVHDVQELSKVFQFLYSVSITNELQEGWVIKMCSLWSISPASGPYRALALALPCH